MREVSDSTELIARPSRLLALDMLLPAPDLMRALKVVVFDCPFPAARIWTATTLAVQALRLLGDRSDDDVHRLRAEALFRTNRSRLRPSPKCWELEAASVLAKIAEASRLAHVNRPRDEVDVALDACLAEALASLAKASMGHALDAQRRRDDANRDEELRNEKARTSEAARERSRKRWRAHDAAKGLALEFAAGLTVLRRARAARETVEYLKRRGWSLTAPTVDSWLREAHWAPAVAREGMNAAQTPPPATQTI